MSDTDSEQSSNPSLSPSTSLHQKPPPPPSLERLVLHYTSAKHSLTSTHYLYRANELVTSSRALIEEIAVLNARNAYLRHGAEEEVYVLEQVRESLEKRGEHASDEFRQVIESLDRADERLTATVRELKATSWDPSLQPGSVNGGQDDGKEVGEESESAEGDAQHKGSKKTLYDFIDPEPYASLQSSLRADIDAFHESHNDFTISMQKLVSSIRTINTTLAQQPSNGPAQKRALYDTDPPLTVRGLFEAIEEHTAALAELLQGLVKHYDLCVNALKHTEGGGAAARDAAEAEGPPTNGSQAVEESLYLRKVPLPMTDEEREEMLNVLERDAAELDEVVAEIKDRSTEQVELYAQLLQQAKTYRKGNTALREVVVMLQEMRDLHLPSHLHALSTFQAEWERLQASMSSKYESLLELAESNEGFVLAYAELLKEVKRRDTVQQKIRRVEERARKEVEKLRELDDRARSHFVSAFGGSLPQGIWEG